MAEIAKDTFAPCSCLVRHLPYSIFCNLLVGYGAHGKRAFMFLVLPLALSTSLFLVAEIDSPRSGVIRVHPQNLESLAESLQSQLGNETIKQN